MLFLVKVADDLDIIIVEFVAQDGQLLGLQELLESVRVKFLERLDQRRQLLLETLAKDLGVGFRAVLDSVFDFVVGNVYRLDVELLTNVVFKRTHVLEVLLVGVDHNDFAKRSLDGDVLLVANNTNEFNHTAHTSHAAFDFGVGVALDGFGEGEEVDRAVVVGLGVEAHGCGSLRRTVEEGPQTLVNGLGDERSEWRLFFKLM